MTHKLDEIIGRLMILETTRLECPEMMTEQDWKDYRHLKGEYADRRAVPRERRMRFRYIRKYNDGIVYHDRGQRSG